MRIKFYATKLLIASLLAVVPIVFVAAQTETLRPDVNINANCNGYWEYLPANYATGSNFPLLIYVSGIGESGNGNTDLSKLTNNIPNGVPYWVHQGVNLSSWTLNGTTYNFVMVAPQWKRAIVNWDTYPTIDEINSFINYTIEHYKVDQSRIYLMGISTGAGSVWHYTREASSYANRIAAIVPFSGTDTPTHARAKILYDRQMPIWGFHNDQDPGVPYYYTMGWKDSLNYWGGPSFAPNANQKFTLLAGTDHVSWYSATHGDLVPGEGPLNVYQWMLQYTHTPPAAQAPVANAGSSKSIISPNSSVQLQGSATDFDSYTLSYSWSRISGPNTPTISNGNTTTPTISGLVEGTYVFRLTATDLTSLSGTSDVQVTVLPPGSLTKIEAESFSANSGGTIYNDATTSAGSYVGNLSPGNWIEFPINTLGGSFNMNFRVGTQFGGSFLVSVGGNAPVTVNVPNINSTYGWRTVGISNFSIPAGAQTLRLTINSGSFGPDMDYLVFQSTALGPLPVRFVYFNAQCSGSSVALQWKTAQEQNTKDFSIQKSTDGVSWTEIGTLAAAGQSNQERNYTFVDRSPGPSSMYRIVENDNIGRFTMSTIVRNSCSFAKNEVSLYPNPSSQNSALSINIDRPAKVSIKIIDSKGATMRQSQLQLPSGSSTLPLNISNYADGVYTITVQYNDVIKTMKLIKK